MMDFGADLPAGMWLLADSHHRCDASPPLPGQPPSPRPFCRQHVKGALQPWRRHTRRRSRTCSGSTSESWRSCGRRKIACWQKKQLPPFQVRRHTREFPALGQLHVFGDTGMVFAPVSRGRAWDGMRTKWGSQGDEERPVGLMFWMEVYLLVLLQA